MTIVWNLFDCLISPPSHRVFLNKRSGFVLSLVVPLALALCLAVLLSPYMLQAAAQNLAATDSSQSALILSRVAMSQRIALVVQPVVTLIVWWLSAMIIAVGAVFANVRPKIADTVALFGRLSLISLVPNLLGYIVICIEQHMGYQLTLQPHFGLDLLIDPATPLTRVIYAYISPFTLWYIAALCHGIAVLFGISVKRALLIVSPLLVLQLVPVIGLALLL
jgi:hypothetical protein